MISPRKAVLELLVRMDETGSFSNIILDNVLVREKFQPRDKAFATMLFYGILERKMTLDYLIRQYSQIEYDKISVETRQVLRMGFFQILYTNSVTESAAVNECVGLASFDSKNFVNAILRNFIRDGAKVNTKALEDEAKLSILYSCPKWLAKLWTRQYGEDAAIGVLETSFGRPPLYIRVNTLRYNAADVITALNREKIEALRNKYLDNCLEVERVSGIELTDAFRKGMFHVQDISSQLCCKITQCGFNETVFDMCSAPGGKSFTLAQMMNNRGRITAFDIYGGRLSLVTEGAKRLGLSIIETVENDALEFNENLGQADRVLCDVPCSGLGVIRRKPEIKYKQKSIIDGLPEIQAKIFETSSRYVKVGGTLVYSTCTLNRFENDEIVDNFQKSHPEFAPMYVPASIPNIEDSSRYTFFPHITGGDGFFTAVFRRIK